MFKKERPKPDAWEPRIGLFQIIILSIGSNAASNIKRGKTKHPIKLKIMIKNTLQSELIALNGNRNWSESSVRPLKEHNFDSYPAIVSMSDYQYNIFSAIWSYGT